VAGILQRMNRLEAGRRPAVGALCDAFGLGVPAGELRAMLGGLSNRLWRCQTDRGGALAVKVMVANATAPDFVTSVEAAFAVERAAIDAGVLAPRPVPVPGSGRCLARVPTVDGGPALVRVHQWVDAQPIAEPSPHLASQLGRALGRLHTMPILSGPPTLPPLAIFGADHWAELAAQARTTAPAWAQPLTALLPVLAELEALVAAATAPNALVAWGHRDADPKNCLAGRRGRLLLVDWDAAGPIMPVHELGGAVLDWSGAATGDPDTQVAHALVEGYQQANSTPMAADERAFAGWCAGTLGWLEFNLRSRLLGAARDDQHERMLGEDEVRWAVTHLPHVAKSLSAWARLLAS
jgi:Ser/Thr protein kinase RdoA (MazF antagonist)